MIHLRRKHDSRADQLAMMSRLEWLVLRPLRSHVTFERSFAWLSVTGVDLVVRCASRR